MSPSLEPSRRSPYCGSFTPARSLLRCYQTWGAVPDLPTVRHPLALSPSSTSWLLIGLPCENVGPGLERGNRRSRLCGPWWGPRDLAECRLAQSGVSVQPGLCFSFPTQSSDPWAASTLCPRRPEEAQGGHAGRSESSESAGLEPRLHDSAGRLPLQQ